MNSIKELKKIQYFVSKNQAEIDLHIKGILSLFNKAGQENKTARTQTGFLLIVLLSLLKSSNMPKNELLRLLALCKDKIK